MIKIHATFYINVSDYWDCPLEKKISITISNELCIGNASDVDNIVSRLISCSNMQHLVCRGNKKDYTVKDIKEHNSLL